MATQNFYGENGPPGYSFQCVDESTPLSNNAGIILVARLENNTPAPVYIGQSDNLIKFARSTNWIERAKREFDAQIVYFQREKRAAARVSGTCDLLRYYEPKLNPAEDYDADVRLAR